MFSSLLIQLRIERERNQKTSRDLQFEKKMHSDLQIRYDDVKKSEVDLQEEYLNLKVNHHRLKETFEDQVKKP